MGNMSRVWLLSFIVNMLEDLKDIKEDSKANKQFVIMLSGRFVNLAIDKYVYVITFPKPHTLLYLNTNTINT